MILIFSLICTLSFIWDILANPYDEHRTKLFTKAKRENDDLGGLADEKDENKEESTTTKKESN